MARAGGYNEYEVSEKSWLYQGVHRPFGLSSSDTWPRTGGRSRRKPRGSCSSPGSRSSNRWGQCPAPKGGRETRVSGEMGKVSQETKDKQGFLTLVNPKSKHKSQENSKMPENSLAKTSASLSSPSSTAFIALIYPPSLLVSHPGY